ncbi:MAG: hypothetical protein Q8O57_13245, partial [Kiritimatiellota bacterium]|nr:hypothetical protein [Kiritimatiellota bacterium]
VTTPTLNSGCTVSYYGIDGTPVTVRNWAYKTLKLDGPGRAFNFTAGETDTVTEAFNAVGTQNQLMRLRSTIGGTRWTINTTGASANLEWLDVMDSAATVTLRAFSSLDSGNNVNWRFPQSGTMIKIR